MKTKPKSKSTKKARATKRLSKALGESKQVKNLIAESAEDLSVVNTLLNQELANPDPHPEVEEALQKNEAIEEKVQDASDPNLEIEALRRLHLVADVALECERQA